MCSTSTNCCCCCAKMRIFIFSVSQPHCTQVDRSRPEASLKPARNCERPARRLACERRFSDSLAGFMLSCTTEKPHVHSTEYIGRFTSYTAVNDIIVWTFGQQKFYALPGVRYNSVLRRCRHQTYRDTESNMDPKKSIKLVEQRTNTVVLPQQWSARGAVRDVS